MDLIWLIPLLPGCGAAINGVAGIRYFSKAVSGLVACATMLAAFVLSVAAFVGLLGLAPDARYHAVTLATWIPPIPLETASGIGRFEAAWAFALDPLSGMMILVVTGIGLLIHVYSTAYMHDESRGAYARYFCYLNLFCFFMLLLVLGSNFLVMFVGWEGVGLCSYLLIGYWYQKKSASDAGKKAFIVNRIGDWGFLLGIFLVFFTFGTLDFRAVRDAAAAMPIETAEVGFGILSTIALLLFVGAVGKSAQIPLFVWLPDAMEGPTPVSALIHAATMVTAGVYMVGRNAVIYAHAPEVMTIVAIVGALTALMAASIGIVQNDIKRVLAYSTVSQLGYMFLAAGAGAFAAGAFHLMTHAFFKALLFLGSGAVIHAMAGEQDMRRMGGLRQYLPVTWATMFIATLAIAGLPIGFSGFFSKDEILFRTFLYSPWLWGLAALTALMTAFYMFRLMSLTFAGPYRGPAFAGGHGGAARHDAGHGGHRAHGPGGHDDHAHGGGHGHGERHGPHEAPPAMRWVLVALALGAIVAGFVGVPPALGGHNQIEHFLEPSFTPAVAPSTAAGALAGEAADEEHHMSWLGEIGLMLFSVGLGVVGMLAAYRVYVLQPEISERLAARFAGAHRVLSNKYYVDELYGGTVVRGTMAGSAGLWKVDRTVVDGAVNGSGVVTVVSAWVSHMIDKYLVDGLVNAVGWTAEESSYVLRRVQTGLIQNYALLMLVGVFAFVSLYLLAR
jgi:NADH-quinone oxidoreductase subunit L